MKERVEVAIAIVFNAVGDKVLICQRKADTVLGGYWEFPGGKRFEGETLEACAIREVAEELGVVIRAVKALPAVEHDYPHAMIRLYPFVCEHVSGVPQLLAVAAARWVAPGEVIGYQFPPANAELLQGVAEGKIRLSRNGARD